VSLVASNLEGLDTYCASANQRVSLRPTGTLKSPIREHE
jgi:hypothetical protein